MNYCYLDFEYNGVAESKLNLISCAYVTNSGESKTYWLSDSSWGALKEDLQRFIDEDYTFIAYAVTAEARSMIALGLGVIKLNFIDLYLEYRCLTNHNHKLAYGKQLIGGKEVVTTAPRYSFNKTEEDDKDDSNSKPEHGLAAACYKLLDVKIDTDHKTEMRDIVIASNVIDIEDNKEEILEYNESDIRHLPKLFAAMVREYKELLGDDYNGKELGKEMRLRGNYAARTACMESLGYPINLQETRNFSDNVYGIIRQTQKEINTLFPDILPFTLQRSYDYNWSHVRTREWIWKLNKPKWTKTDTGMDSLSLKAFRKYFSYSHDYPTDCLGAQLVRYLNLKQNLNGFVQSASAKKKKNFWDSVGSDGRVRPYFGIYGAQSARSQPSATSFLFLKSAWMRVLCQPKKGRAICAIDYKSQEFLLAALMSGDMDMLKAYQSGDVYLYFAKLAGAVPWDGKRCDHEDTRNLFKQVVLALSYGMGHISLREELTTKVGRPFSEREAKEFIEMFNTSFPVYYRWKFQILNEYKRDKYIKLPCGWYHWGDNPNSKSVGNVPVQGFGSSIMRKAVGLAQDRGLDVILTLHDALYIEYDSEDFGAVELLAECMDSAFRFYFKGSVKKIASVGLDANVWSPDYEDGYFDTQSPLLGSIKRQKLYIDGRSVKQYETYKKYFKGEEIEI